jgi:hypothetical protein
MERDAVQPEPAAPVEAGAELDRLLRTGPFADALRAAIRSSRLSQGRLLERLRSQGVPVSSATLSFWQSGRSRPERPTSLAALRSLEEVLGVGPGALSRLLAPPLPRGRRASPPEHIAFDDLWSQQEAMRRILDRVDVSQDSSLVRISQHDRVEIGPDGGELSVWTRSVLRARADGPDRCVHLYHVDEPGCPPPEIRPLRGCRLGTVHAEPEAGLYAAELLFPHPLGRGETTVIEYSVANSEPYPRDGNYERILRLPIREYVLEVQFAAPARPARCTTYWSPDSTAESATTERAAALDEDGRMLLIALDAAPGVHGARWDFEPSQA